MTGRAGAVSLAELVLVFWLFGFILTATAGFATAVGRLSAVQRDRTRTQEVVRAARVILSAELRHGVAAQLVAGGGDSLRLRAARGTGAICAAEGPELVVRYRGVRRPEPAKDSLLLVSASGARVAGAITAVAGTDRCGGALLVRIEEPPGAGIGEGGGAGGLEVPGVALVFESGTYHVQGGALRYRRGAAGRQPLTEALLHPSSALEAADGRVALRLVLRPDSLRTAAPGPVLRERVTRLNPGSVP